MSDVKGYSGSASSNEKIGVDEERVSNAPDSVDLTLDAIDEKKLLRKLDFALIPWLSFLYLLSFLDRTSIGNAKVSFKSGFSPSEII